MRVSENAPEHGRTRDRPRATAPTAVAGRDMMYHDPQFVWSSICIWRSRTCLGPRAPVPVSGAGWHAELAEKVDRLYNGKRTIKVKAVGTYGRREPATGRPGYARK